MLEVNIRAMSYPRSTRGKLIENLQFEVSGGVSSFVGPSGAGKTTLLRIIAGLEKDFEGTVLLEGQPIAKPSRKVQIVFQDNRLLPWKTVFENIEFALPGRSGANGALLQERAQVLRWLSTVRLSEKIDSWPKTLSGGEEARVAFARTFIDPPRVLLLDEPFHNLDIQVRSELREELTRVIENKKIIALLVSHNVEDAVLLSDTIYIVSADPMTIRCVISNPLQRPRLPASSDVLDMVAHVTSRLLERGDSNE